MDKTSPKLCQTEWDGASRGNKEISGICFIGTDFRTLALILVLCTHHSFMFHILNTVINNVFLRNMSLFHVLNTHLCFMFLIRITNMIQTMPMPKEYRYQWL